MSLSPPILDDRTFQDIVDELKTRIPLYCPEWTDHNVSDPGVTLIELFAYMAEQLIYRMNRVPELHYLKFVDFLGIPIPTPQPARVPVTIWLSKPLVDTAVDEQGGRVLIEKGTQVSTTQTEITEPLVFSIEQEQEIVAPRLVSDFKWSRESGGQIPPIELLISGAGAGIDLFSTTPEIGDYFFFLL